MSKLSMCRFSNGVSKGNTLRRIFRFVFVVRKSPKENELDIIILPNCPETFFFKTFTTQKSLHNDAELKKKEYVILIKS